MTLFLAIAIQYSQYYAAKRAEAASQQAWRCLAENDVCIDPYFAFGPTLFPHVITFPGKTKTEIRKLIPELATLKPWESMSGISIFLHPNHFSDPTFRNELAEALPNCSIHDAGQAGTLVRETYAL